ncbi:maleylpyruvate isomerase family mycothiol-dependent enzyme [Rhodobacterales bacterium HKCCE2091]|nr:maleylpyruvate isomerase family mycothiol-dependent enzyme [Rhodobacterales bacterium HKCCE2091]
MTVPRALCDDLEAECLELDAWVSTLPDADWETQTGFFAWTTRDQILHLNQIDRFGLASFDGPEVFAAAKASARAGQAKGKEFSEQARDAARGMSRSDVMEAWRDGYRKLLARFRAADAKDRISWFGPDMSVVSFAAARQMEAWAHGQDIYDMKAAPRPLHDRISNICDLGMRTFGWSFANRGLPVPEAPSLSLTLPSGVPFARAGAGNGSVQGTAIDFALVVTQRRPVEETSLVATGAGLDWLPIAQCFAGPPQARAEPGERPPFQGFVAG